MSCSGKETISQNNTITEESTIFEQAKELFDEQFPRIQFADIGEETEIHIEMIEYDEYEDILELDIDFGKARGFVEFDSRSGELIIEPDEDDAGEYSIEVTLTDGSEEYERIMLLYVTADTKNESLSLEKFAEKEEDEDDDREESESETFERFDDDEEEYEKEFLFENYEDGEEFDEELEREEEFDVEEVMLEILEIEDGCDEDCLKEKVKEIASEKLQEAIEEIKTETKINIDGREIKLDLEKLTQNDVEDDDEISEVQEIMEQVEDLPIEVQQEVFDTILNENA